MPNLIFLDSFDHYSNESVKWDGVITTNLSNTKGRTGIGCLVIDSGTFGPTKTFSASSFVSFGGAFYYTEPSFVVQMLNVPFGNAVVTVQINGLLGFTLTAGSGVGTIGTSTPGVFQLGTYNYIELSVNVGSPGEIVLKCNGAVVFDFVGPTNQNGTISVVQLMGASNAGVPDSRWDDVYIADWTHTPSVPFFGPVKIYAEMPTADASPLNWSPNSGTVHFVLVDEIPPDNDVTYVSDGTPGDIDQYTYQVTGIPSDGAVQTLQHDLDTRADAGTPTICSVAAGNASSQTFQPSTSYRIFTTAWDNDPGGGAWALAHFPKAFGPKEVS